MKTQRGALLNTKTNKSKSKKFKYLPGDREAIENPIKLN
jgi:hypothetical protein